VRSTDAASGSGDDNDPTLADAVHVRFSFVRDAVTLPASPSTQKVSTAHRLNTRSPPFVGTSRPADAATSPDAETADIAATRRTASRDTRAMTSFIFNVTFDCAHPRTLARFWSEVTGYAIAEERDDYARLHAPDQRGVRHLLFFQVPEPKSSKNRVHIDLASRTPETEIERLVALGASLVDPGDSPQWRTGNGTRWVTMRDPEGNEFCVG
jgi:hypothetical protein